ncbi:MAG TPA: ATP phosphoribosyltransferase [Anaerolineae bacterium]|nr:ATP phosphoribosyltransferase [Anaerolineae bacterium]HNU05491.1 ATP phosphoribosyltransferase [Anaerolineae bacterium]
MVESLPLAASQHADPSRLVVALPKGRLLDEARGLLAQAGYGLLEGDNGRQLVLPSAAPHVRYVLAKPSDVPVYVEYGACDLGIAGLDVLREAQRDLLEPLLLPFGYCRLAVAGPAERAGRPLRLEPNPRVATKFPRLTEAFFRQRGVSAEIIELSGSVELAPLVDLADLVVDLVQSGQTLADNGLAELRVILHSQAVLVANRAAWRLKSQAIGAFVASLRDRSSVGDRPEL